MVRVVLVLLAAWGIAACERKADPPPDPYLAELRARLKALQPEVEREIGRKLGTIEVAILPYRRIREDRIPWWREVLARIENGPRGDELDAELRALAEDNVECVVATVDTSGRVVLPDPREESAMDEFATFFPPTVFDLDLRARDVLLIHEMIHVHQSRHLERPGFWGSVRSRADIRARTAVLEGHAEYLTRRIASRIGLEDVYAEYQRGLERTGRYVVGEKFVATAVERLGYEEAIRRIFSAPPSLAVVSRPDEYFRRSEASGWAPVSEDLRRWLARECGEANLDAVFPAVVDQFAGDVASGLREGFHLEADAVGVAILVLVAEDTKAAAELHLAWTEAMEHAHQRVVDAGIVDANEPTRTPDAWTLHDTWSLRGLRVRPSLIRQHTVRDGVLIVDVRCTDSETEQGAERLARRAIRFLTDASWREAWLKGDRDLLESEDPALRLAAVSRLRRFVPDEDWEVRWLGRFCEARDERGSEEARTAALVAAIKDPHPATVARGLRAAADMLLWHVPWPLLRERLDHEDAAVRRAAWGLIDTQISHDGSPEEWQAPRREAVDLVAAALEDADVNVREAAADCLSQLKGEPDVESVFRKALLDGHPRVRKEALRTLRYYRFDFPELLPEIVALLPESPDVASEALGLLGPVAEVAVPPLRETLKGTKGRAEAAAAIWKIVGDAEPLFALVTESVAQGKPTGIEELGEMAAAARPAVPDVAKALAHESRWIRIEAAAALGKIGGPEANKALEDRLGVERDPKVVEAIRKALEAQPPAPKAR